MPAKRAIARMLAVALACAAPELAISENRTPCERWSPQISEHLDWICARGAGHSVPVAVRPPASAICHTMNDHISDLLNRHRRSTEMDDAEFDAALRKFYEAQTICEAGRYDEALSLYTLIPLRRPTALLR